MIPSDKLEVSVQASEPEPPLGPGPPGVLLVAVHAPVASTVCQCPTRSGKALNN